MDRRDGRPGAPRLRLRLLLPAGPSSNGRDPMANDGRTSWTIRTRRARDRRTLRGYRVIGARSARPGRLAYFARFGDIEGPAVILEAQPIEADGRLATSAPGDRARWYCAYRPHYMIRKIRILDSIFSAIL